MKKIFLYKLSGEYWGFISDNYIYDINNEYFGWLDSDNLAWYKNGKYLGVLFQNNYIVINYASIKPISRIPIEEPVTKFSVNMKINKMKRVADKGWSDTLKNK